MADIKWIKLSTGLPDNKKIKQIRTLPNGDSIALMWVFLMCLAGDTNEDGLVYFTPEIPFTDEMLAEEFRMNINTIRLGLKTFERFGMIEVIDDIICLTAWEKWQAADKLENIREKTRKRVAKHRAKQKLLAGNVTSNADVTPSNAIEEDIEEDKEKEGDIEGDKEPDDKRPGSPVPYDSIKSMYNEICVSFPRCTSLSDARKKAIKARFASGYNVEDFKALFTKAEASSFLKGKNDRSWSATFDWLIKDTNMAKVLDGNYDDKGGGGRGATPGNPGESKHYGTYL